MSSSRLPAFSLALVLGAVLAAGNVAVGQRVAPELLALPPVVAWLAGAPILVALVLAAVLHRPAAAPAAAPAPPPRDDTPALRLLAALQDEGRLVDFLRRTSRPTPTSRSAPPSRGIHELARKALRERIDARAGPAGREDEHGHGAATGFDPAAHPAGRQRGRRRRRSAASLRARRLARDRVTLPVRRGQDEQRDRAGRGRDR